MSPTQVQALSERLGEELAAIINTPADNFTIEQIASQFFRTGQPEQGYPFIEVLWFERPPDVRLKTARHLTERVKAIIPSADVAVVFFALDPQNYFENGQHF